MASVGLPVEYPVRAITCEFAPYEYENSPYSFRPKHVTGFELNLELPLREPTRFSEGLGRKILYSLNLNTGLGEYRQLPNGKHQIVIPGEVFFRINEGAPAWVARNFPTSEGVTTVLELGIDDPKRGIRYLRQLKNREIMTGLDEDYLDERIKQLEEILQEPQLDKLRIRLKSDEAFGSGIDQGDNNQIEGRKRGVKVDKEILDKFFERAAFLLEAICDTLGPKERRRVLVRVEHPDVNLIAGGEDVDILGKPPSSLFIPGVPLDDWVKEAGKALEEQRQIIPEIPKQEISTDSESPRPETFSEYMREFLQKIRAKTIVEIGSDVRLRVAGNLAPYCEKYYSVNLPDATRGMQGWYELRKSMEETGNIELISGNAVELSKLVPHADVIILHNVLLDLTGTDTALMWDYKEGRKESTEKEWAELASRFSRAKEQGYREFLKVAKPGHIVVFQPPDPENSLGELLVETLGVDLARIERKQLYYDESHELWEAYLIDNTQS